MENGSLLELVGSVVDLAACPGICIVLLSPCCHLRQLSVAARACASTAVLKEQTEEA